jgi:hypothetical protein
MPNPEMTEELKWRRPRNPTGTPVFERDGIVCMVGILKERVRLTLYAGATLPDPHKLFNAVLEGNKTRAVDIYEGDKISTKPPSGISSVPALSTTVPRARPQGRARSAKS